MDPFYIKNLIWSLPSCLWEKNLSLDELKKIEVENISIRPYSIVAKCKVVGMNVEKGVYVKYYRKKREDVTNNSIISSLRRDFETLAHYYKKFNGDQKFGVVKPLFVVPEKYILVTQEAIGKNLFQLIERDAAFYPSKNKQLDLNEKLRLTGAWLRYFHSLDSFSPAEYSIDALIEYMIVRLDILTEDKRRHFPVAYRNKILKFVGENKHDILDAELILHSSHNDFNLGNIIFENGRVTALDFAKTKKDSFLLDVSRIYHQLYLMTFKPQYRMGIIKRLQKALLEGFGMPSADQLMMFRFLLIRHTLTHLVGITRFWEKDLKEKMYNYWVLYKELHFLDSLLSQ